MADVNTMLANLLNNQQFLFVAGSLILAYMFLKRYKDEKEEEFEKKPLEEMTTDRISKELKTFGIDVNKKLLITNMNGYPEQIGVVKKVIQEKVPLEPVNIAPYDYEGSEDSDISFDEDSESSEGSEEESEEDQDYDLDENNFSGDWNIEELDENEYKEVVKALVIPSDSAVDRFIYYVTDVLLGMDVKSNYYVLSKDHLKEKSSDLQIKKDTNMKFDAGLFISHSPESENIRNKYVRSENLERTIESIPNFTKKIDHMFPKHSMDIDRIQEKLDEDEGGL